MTTGQAPKMTLRMQAEVTKRHEPDYAMLVMADVRELRRPLVVLARGCPGHLAVGDTAVFSGELEIRLERAEQGQQVTILPVLAIQETGPATTPSPWAHLECEARVGSGARSYTAPIQDADGMVVMSRYTVLGARLPARERKSVHLCVLYQSQPLPLGYYAHHEQSGTTFMVGERAALSRATGEERPDETAALLMALHEGDHVRLGGDLCLMERAPDDDPGADLQLMVETIERVLTRQGGGH